MHTHTHTHTHIYIYIYMHIHVRIHTHIHEAHAHPIPLPHTQPRIVSPVPYGPRRTPGFPNCSVPAIASSCWRAPNGSVALFVVNHHNSTVVVELEIVIDWHWGSEHSRCASALGSRSNPIVHRVSMDPLSDDTAYLHPGNACYFT